MFDEKTRGLKSRDTFPLKERSTEICQSLVLPINKFFLIIGQISQQKFY